MRNQKLVDLIAQGLRETYHPATKLGQLQKSMMDLHKARMDERRVIRKDATGGIKDSDLTKALRAKGLKMADLLDDDHTIALADLATFNIFVE